MPFLRAVFCEGQDFRPVFCHQNCVFKLSRQRPVDCAYSPLVFLVDTCLPRANIQHRFDGEASSGTQEISIRLQRWEMRNTGFLMKIATDSVALILANN